VTVVCTKINLGWKGLIVVVDIVVVVVIALVVEIVVVIVVEIVVVIVLVEIVVVIVAIVEAAAKYTVDQGNGPLMQLTTDTVLSPPAETSANQEAIHHSVNGA